MWISLRRGHRLEFRDLMIGTTAIEMNMALVMEKNQAIQEDEGHGPSTLPPGSLKDFSPVPVKPELL